MKKAILTLALFALMGGLALADGGRGYMGVTVAGANHDNNGVHANGFYITDVQEGSGAAVAGLQSSDRIVSINGVEIAAMRDLDEALGGTLPGQSVSISVMRGDTPHTYDVTLGDKPMHAMSFGGHGNKPFGKWVIEHAEATPRMGVALQPLEGQLAAYFDVSAGMLVTRVVEDSGAWRAGLQAGDVLLEVAGASIESIGDIRSALKEFTAGDTVDVTVQRRGSIDRFAVVLEKAATLSAGEMTFNVALHDDGHEGDGQTVTVDLHGSDVSFGSGQEPVTVRFGDATEAEDLEHRIHQLQQELHHLQQQLERTRKD